MRFALDRIDEVARYEGSEQAVYDQKVEAAREAILVCHKRRITGYDGQLVPALDTQLASAQAVHKARLKAATDQQYVHMLKVLQDSDQQTEAMLREHLQ
jgi:hypothetical protein